MFDKGQTIENANIINSTIIQGDFSIDPALINQLVDSAGNNKLLNKLIRENLNRMNSAICELDFKLCNSLVDTVFSYGLNGIDKDLAEQLYYYRYLMKAISDDNDALCDCKDFLSEEITDEIFSVLLKDIDKLEIETVVLYREETQICILNQCFNKGYFAIIIAFYENRSSSLKNNFNTTWEYFYSLALFNTEKYKDASNVINRLKEKTKKPYHQLLGEIFEIHRLKKDYFDKDIIRELRERYNALKSILRRDPFIMKGNDALLISTRLGAALCLGKETFLDEYSTLTIEERKTDCAKFFNAIYHEEIGDFQKSLEINMTISHVEQAIIHHRLLCLKHLYRWNDVVECYNRYCAEDSNAAFDGLYISALMNVDEILYKGTLEKACNKYKTDVLSICSIGLAVEERSDDFNQYIVPIVNAQIDEILNSESEWLKFTYAMMLFHCNQNELCLLCIKAIRNFSIIDRLSIRHLCKELFETSSITAVLKEQISDCFLINDIEKESFLQLKINALTEQMKYIDAIRCSEELYELTHDKNVARNIIALVVNNYPSSTSQYTKYYQILELTQNPSNLMAAAAAYSALGRSEEADRCAYNAALFQKDETDYNFYVSYVSFSLREVFEHRDKTIEQEFIGGNSAVTLVGEKSFIVCLENSNDTNGVKVNNALGALHVYNTEPLYYKLSGKRLNDTIVFEGMEYKIESIIDKYTHAFHFATAKLEENPNPETMPIKMLKVSDGTDLIRQMQEAFPKSDSKENLINAYHMEDGGIGLPIEAIIGGNYEDYLEIVDFLLTGEDQALYAGQIDEIEITDNQLIVPTLSSMVILEKFGCLDLLLTMKDSIFIPESMLLFVRKRVEQMKKTIEVSPGKMYNLPDGKFTMIPPDTSTLKVWEKILECCLDFTIEPVLDKEVAEFPFLEQMSGESLFNQFKLDRSQLECMILAKKQNAILLSDDLFYRKIAGPMGLTNINSGCLLKCKFDSELMKDIMVQMSSTNYIYIPFIELDMERFKVVLNNLAKGKKKRQYYSHIFESANKIVMDMFAGMYCSSDVVDEV